MKTARITASALLTALFLLLASCGGGIRDLSPEELFDKICSEAELAVMTDAAELLEEDTGIAPENYESAVYALPDDGLAPDEIIIIRAKSEQDASAIQEKLLTHLAYKRMAAEDYMTEFLPVIEDGVVRRDGLTVSLLISEKIDLILKVYR